MKVEDEEPKVDGEQPFDWPWPDDEVVDASIRVTGLFSPPSGGYDRVQSVINEWLSSIRATTPFGLKVRNLRAHLANLSDEDLIIEVMSRWLGGVSYVASQAAGRMSAGFWVRLVPDAPQKPSPQPIAALDLAAVSTARKLAASGQARAIRETARITLTEMAGRLGTTAGTVSRWERGSSMPGAAIAEKWLAVLETLDTATNTTGEANAA